jgi:hypothetical protein
MCKINMNGDIQVSDLFFIYITMLNVCGVKWFKGTIIVSDIGWIGKQTTVPRQLGNLSRCSDYSVATAQVTCCNKISLFYG